MLGIHYDYQNAVKRLETLAKKRITTGYLAHPLTRYANVGSTPATDEMLKILLPQDIPRETFVYTNTHSAKSDVWRVVEHTADDGQPEESVFTVHGIIVQCELPPVVRPYPQQSAAKYVQQKVTLTGFQSQIFNDSISGILHVDGHLRMNVRENGPAQYLSQQDMHATLEIGNRYFTSKRLASTSEHIPFPPTIDPKGILEDLRGNHFLHTPENQVEYYEAFTVNDEQRYSARCSFHQGPALSFSSFRTVSPAFIKCGDIVEVQLTVSLVDHPQGKNDLGSSQYITKLILRSITLLDQSFSEKRRLASILPTKQVTLKRKIGHDEEQTREAQERLKRMAIDR
ncbi:hypothetical protein VNI00_008948 [Paramarasmius palmivorus]|uniref:Uncharacterized protein n=1 Tax=Paramarasmius palmivorus TaxID=297713 RepID=A0AAW0CT54_9AGAR